MRSFASEEVVDREREEEGGDTAEKPPEGDTPREEMDGELDVICE